MQREVHRILDLRLSLKPSTTEPEMYPKTFYRVWAIQRLRERGGTITCLEVLEEFRGIKASDPRDIVYAALNLANDKLAKSLVPDYENPAAVAYREVAV